MSIFFSSFCNKSGAVSVGDAEVFRRPAAGGAPAEGDPR